ncbi:hypothetical protein CVT26_011633 [Gymnopilus dilepis]|uniref:MYND-type domain-containing protein n=1 Tax=Gymnopilus dilepis TaxID=231916 RepID=A0A409YQL1_9AGAR|nr:hypothetical protein CVT26_011633 [Gymnopilus dilepis]
MASESELTTRSCLVCGSPTTKSCSGCKSASYCNDEHQKQDWRSHKEYCLKIKAAGTNTFDAILFPATETKPRLVKVPWKLVHEDPNDPYALSWQQLDNSPWFKHPNSAVKSHYIPRWGINGRELEHPLCMRYDDNFGMNGLPLNRCVVSLTKGQAGHQWCGNILALRMGESYDYYDNVNMEEDLKALVKYFEEYNKVMPKY